MNKPLPPWDWQDHWYNHLGMPCWAVSSWRGLNCNSGWAAGCHQLTCYLGPVARVIRGDTARDVKVFMVGLVPVLEITQAELGMGVA